MKAKKFKSITVAFVLMIPALGFGQIAPNLNSAADFAVLAATGISFAVPQSTITNMDVGLHSGVRSLITGDVAGLNLIGGMILATDQDDLPPRLPQAKEDLRLAYLFAAAAPSDATISDNQGGLTLYPGVYTSGSSLAINDTPLTLDAQGNENAVWIFQIGTSLTTTIGGDVILAGGAKANNVYWQVGSSATIGNDTDFKGNILAMVSISINTGATIDGRALARTGAVTFAGGNEMDKPEESLAAAGDLSITKTANPLTFSAVNDQIDYTIVVGNIGTVTITNITVTDDLTNSTWFPVTLGPGVSETFTTSYNITAANLQNGFVVNTATAEAVGIATRAYAYVIVTKEGWVDPPPAIPLATWAIVLGGLLIAGFMAFQYRRTTRKQLQGTDVY